MRLTILTGALLLATAVWADSAAGIKWTAPSAWKQEGARPMRVATYAVPAAKGDSEGAECAVFYFGTGQGGSVEANINRWVGQFETPDGKAVSASPKKGKVNGLSVTRLELEGTYLASMGPMAASGAVKKPGYKLLGAIVEAPEGPVFFKLTGPTKTVNGAKADFEKLVRSLSR